MTLNRLQACLSAHEACHVTLYPHFMNTSSKWDVSFFRVCTEVSSIRNTYLPSLHKLATKLITIDGITAAFLQTFANYRTDELMPPCLICLSDLSVCVYFCQPCKSARDNFKIVFPAVHLLKINGL